LAGIAIFMFILAAGFHSATYTLDSEGISQLPAEIPEEGLRSLQDVEFKSDVQYKKALENSIGKELLKEHSSILISKAIQMNPLIILIGVIGFVASFAVSIGPVMWAQGTSHFIHGVPQFDDQFFGTAGFSLGTGNHRYSRYLFNLWNIWRCRYTVCVDDGSRNQR
jgi:hypothetical protein